MQTFLFDLDGTIGNTLPLCIAAFRESLESLSGKRFTDDEIVATFGPSEEGTIAMLLPEMEQEGVEAYVQSYEALHDDWPVPFEGILEILDFIKAKTAFVGLVTGKGARSTAVTLHRYGLTDFFDVVKTGAVTGPVKDLRIEEVIHEFSLSREDILYVGDAPSDISAARTCSVKVVAAAWAPTADRTVLESLKPDYLFASIDDFSKSVKQMLNH